MAFSSPAEEAKHYKQELNEAQSSLAAVKRELEQELKQVRE